MMNPKYLIGSLAAAMVVAGGLAYAQTSEPTPTTQLQTPATEPAQGNPAATDSTLQSPSNSSGTPSGTSASDAPMERDAQADRN
jgi:hypothetical protein